MNVNGVAASLNFGSWPGFDGGVFVKVPDKAQAITHLRAYNDWHIDEWCGPIPGRFIPCAILPCWDPKSMVEELKRVARKGCTAISINENPTIQGLPSIHNPYWEPLFKAVVEEDIAICLHIGGGNPAPHASMETPIEAWIQHHAHFHRRRSGRLAASRGARALSDDEDRALGRRHRLDSVFHGAQ